MTAPPGHGKAPSTALLLAIFLCSLSAISFEITLTRVFSISLWYHFAFMVISIAMLGIGLSGTVLSLYPRLADDNLIGAYALGLSASVVLGYLLSNMIPFDPERLAWDAKQLLFVSLYYATLSVPFLFFGLIVSASFALYSQRSALIYGADLLGAGVGSVLSLALIAELGAEAAVFAISLGGLAGAFFLGRRGPALILAAAVVVVAAAGPDFTRVRMSEYKGLRQALMFPGSRHLLTYHGGFSRVDIFESPMVRYAPGLSLRYLEALPRQVGLAVDGSQLNAVTEAGGNTDFLMHLPAALPYEIRRRESALIAEPKGGLPVLLARKYGAGHIESAESNPLIVDAVRRGLNDMSGRIYGRGTSTGLARSLLLRTDTLYDVIDLSLTSPVPSALVGISEDYMLTVEAFGQYLSHLSPEGVLSLNMFLLPPPRAELRLLNTALAALREAGAAEPQRHIAAIRSWGSINIIVKKTPISQDEIGRIKEFSMSRNFDLVYYPGIAETETNIYVELPENDYYRAFAALLEPGGREAFLEKYVFDVREVRDNSPFFHYYLKLRNVGDIYELAGGKWQYFIEHGYLLPAVLAQVALLSLVLLAMPALRRGLPGPCLALLYFAFLALGFMFVEMPLIQGMILPLENPSYAVAAVLASVLVSSGSGSLLSQRFGALRTPYTVLAIALVALPYALGLPVLAGSISALPLALKFAICFVAVMPVGLLMGIPLPLGMRLLGRSEQGMIPWAWAVNGCFSVLAPVLAAMLALSVGFKVVLLMGSLSYALAFALIRRPV